MIHNSIAELIGSTPLLELRNIEKELGLNAHIIAKLEYLNPTGSAKDRAALSMIDDAEEQGIIRSGDTIIEPTSGNTGIALASIAASRGYKAIIVMPDSMSEERRITMEAYGAEVVLTPGADGMAGAIRKAEEIRSTIPGSFIPSQFDNKANAEAHYRTTGPEILKETEGHADFLVAGVGSGGTLTGTGRYLKEHLSNIKLIAVEPASSPVLSGGEKGSHGIEGIGAGFIPSILDSSIIDEIITVEDDDALKAGRLIGKLEGFLAGISSGAALSAAIRIAERKENEGKNIIVILPDSGDRYLSTKLYRG